jgi:hypothetical protein
MYGFNFLLTNCFTLTVWFRRVMARIRSSNFRIALVDGVIRPPGLDDFAELYIQKSDLHSVTVEGQGKYRVYPYEGAVSDIENIKLLLSWTQNV